MNYKELADLLFPDITKTIEDYEEIYPKRILSEGAEVCRFAPSPTGRMHMGNLYAAFFPEVFAIQSNGIFILRIEDTDDKRAIENGTKLILDDLKSYNYKISENPIDGGLYGPYIQSQRKDIYAAFAKYLISIGRAYPCFCSEDDLNEMRKVQENKKDRVGYYGKYAKCRNLSIEKIKEKINNGEKYVIRLKSIGNFNKKIVFHDCIKGKIELPENDIDHVLLKTDGIPPYAFAHVVDDHLMRTTIVTRDDSYISSVPYHLEIWNAFGFEIPKFAHLLPLCVKDCDCIRKISKRKDPEAAVSYYHERGISTEAIKLYFATLLNSNFEMWYMENPDKGYRDFKFTFDKMSTSGSLFDIDKLNNISKNYISRLNAKNLYDMILAWAIEFDKELESLITNYKDYTIKVLNIEREVSRPRKDISNFSEVKKEIGYMFDELFFDNVKYNDIDIKPFYDSTIIIDYINNYFNENDDKETWFNKIKEFASANGFASETKEYKLNPDNYKGHVGDICELIRVITTGRTMTPDLYEILKLLRKERILKRIEHFKNVVKK
jgi:glutamyl-tRNA synthetase